MIRNMNVARELGYLNVPANTLVDSKEIDKFAPERTVLISTGSQGEPLSALSRIAQRTHNFVHLEEGDTVVLASSLIPRQRERRLPGDQRVSRWGAHVVHKGNALVHVSGHASAGELSTATILSVRATCSRSTARSATSRPTPRSRGRPASSENVVVAEDGMAIDLVDGKIEVAGKVPVGYVYVDGQSVGDITEVLLKDRRILGEEGFISVIVVVDMGQGKVARSARRSTPAGSPRTTASSTRSSSRSSTP